MKALGKVFLAFLITGMILGLIMCTQCVKYFRDPEKVINDTIEEMYK